QTTRQPVGPEVLRPWPTEVSEFHGAVSEKPDSPQKEIDEERAGEREQHERPEVAVVGDGVALPDLQILRFRARLPAGDDADLAQHLLVGRGPQIFGRVWQRHRAD